MRKTSERDVTAHMDVVATDQEQEEQLITEYVEFVKERILATFD